MKKYFIPIVSIFPSFVFAQSVYMHEAQDDAANSEPISFLGIITICILVGVGYIVYKLFEGVHNKIEDRKIDAKHKEFLRQYETKKNGGFICPICGKQVMDNNFITKIHVLEGKAYNIKICNNCDDIHYPRRYRKRQKNLPNWIYSIPFILWAALGLFVLIKNCIQGEIFMGIIGMILVPPIVGGLLGLILMLFQGLFKISTPKDPLNKISLTHIRDCNAIKE